MTTAAGREVVSYIVRCALAAGTSLTKKDQYGTSYTFQGSLGFAPQWKDGACDTNCQEFVSACLMAHINTAGVHIPIWIVAQPSTVGWSLSPDYTNQEGSFFGNLFVMGAHGTPTDKVPAFYCNGKEYDDDVVAGRIGANQVGAPYRNPYVRGPYSYAAKGYCNDVCARADAPNTDSGYKSCSGWNNVVTVYRKPASGGTITAPTTSTGLTATLTKYAEKTSGYCANVTVKNNTSSSVSSWKVVYDIGGASQWYEWYATFSHVGGVYTAKPKMFASIPAGGSRTFGFCARYSGSTPYTPVIKSVSTF